MTATFGLVVTGIGAITPVGLSAPASFAALRAGVARFGEVETLRVDSETMDKVPAIGGRVPTEWFTGGPVEWEWPAHERFGVEPPPAPERLVAPDERRLLELAVPAALEAWRQAVPSGTSGGGAGLYLGLDYADDPDALIAALPQALGESMRPVGATAAGRAAGLLALEAAAHDLLAGTVRLAVVGGVDSQIRGPSLQRMAARGILRSGSNPQGVIPGEAAGFLVLERYDLAAARGARPLAALLACASDKEPTAGTDEPNKAAGLGAVLRRVRNEAGLSAPPLVVCDLNGDRYRAMEWSMAMLRSLGDLHGELDIWHPADCIGDTGAASASLNIGWGITAMRKGYAKNDRVLVWGASEGRSRAAAVLAAAT
jgi:3-oxoacyl-[acyl-carrier-protein] synthase I